MWFRRRENKSGEEARLAFEDAVQQLDAVEKRDVEVKNVVRAHEDLQKRNHFAERMQNIIIGIGAGVE